MKVVRRPLDLKSSLYSRSWDVPRGLGCHLMPIIYAISRTSGWSPKRNDTTADEADLERYRLSGFLWESVMSTEDRLEYAMSTEFRRAEARYRSDVIFPDELYWCYQCDDVIKGDGCGEEHARTRRHTGIFFNIDYLNHERERVGEMKWTRKSVAKASSNASLEVREWIAQNQFYCRGVGWFGGEFRVCFENGDYTFPQIPQIYEFNIDYEERELRNNWSMVVSTARAMEWI